MRSHVSLKTGCPAIPAPFGLHCETERHFVRSVENLEQVVAHQATELAPGAGPRHQFDAAVAGPTIGTGDIGFSHGRENNTLTTVVLPGRCAGREAGRRGLTLVKQSPSPQLIVIDRVIPR